MCRDDSGVDIVFLIGAAQYPMSADDAWRLEGVIRDNS
jgi:hypothetical protein